MTDKEVRDCEAGVHSVVQELKDKGQAQDHLTGRLVWRDLRQGKEGIVYGRGRQEIPGDGNIGGKSQKWEDQDKVYGCRNGVHTKKYVRAVQEARPVDRWEGLEHQEDVITLMDG